jgi:Ankyrin repeats (3 copies)
MPDRVTAFEARLSSTFYSMLVMFLACGFLSVGLSGCSKGSDSKTDASASGQPGNGSVATTKPEAVSATTNPVVVQVSSPPATKPAVFPMDTVADYFTISLRMINWYQNAPVESFREHSDAVLKAHGLADTRPPQIILNNGDGYSLVDGKAGTDLAFNDNWFDPISFFCGRRGDFPDIQVRRGSIALAQQGSTYLINVADGTEIRTSDGFFVRRSGEWIQQKPEPFFTDSDLQRLNDLEFLKKKVTTKEDANAKDITGRSCLQRASETGAFASAKYLIEMGADVNFVYEKSSTSVVGGGMASIQNHRETALAAAIFNERWDCATLLVESGADVNDKGETVGSVGLIQVPVEIVPLVSAAGSGQEQLVKLMLSKKADINLMSSLTDSAQKTALMAAVANNHPSIVKMLLDAGADTSIKNWSGETALQIARENNLPEIAKLIESLGTSPAK